MSIYFEEPDFRYRTLLGNATREFHAMSTYSEKVGAHRMVSLLSSHLTNAYKEKEQMTVKSLVSTIGALERNLFQDLLILTPRQVPQCSPVGQAFPPLLPLNQSSS